MDRPIDAGLSSDLIAPCGLNCALCLYHQQGRRCPGCWKADVGRHRSMQACKVRSCPRVGEGSRCPGKACLDFPCQPLQRLDKRYRSKYRTSPIQNLLQIEGSGMDAFLERQAAASRCPGCGTLVCMHRAQCPKCDASYG